MTDLMDNHMTDPMTDLIITTLHDTPAMFLSEYPTHPDHAKGDPDARNVFYGEPETR